MGPLLSTHPVHRRRFGGLVALTVSLICSLLVVLAFVLDFDGAQLALLAFAFPLLISVPAAVVMLRNSRLQETFELHEDGLARVRNGVRQAWTWNQVRALDLTPRGTDLVCAIRFDDDEVVSFSATDTDREAPALLFMRIRPRSSTSARSSRCSRAAAAVRIPRCPRTGGRGTGRTPG
ncbi:hypothetical protein ABZX92_36855 [Lentzea sp. NPDC006480]|uniref:hypothetical protein n=1 Tax=Lentzea sp. NPDC006480 TaxID=3157176 RepID=UPI0033B17014